MACKLAQAFAQMIRSRDVSALASWLAEATTSRVPELRTFAEGIRRDQVAVLAALTYDVKSKQRADKRRELRILQPKLRRYEAL